MSHNKKINESIEKYFYDIKEFIIGLSEEQTDELSNYLDYLDRYYCDKKYLYSTKINIGKIKIFLLSVSRLLTDYNAKEILSYLESLEFGWYNNKYHFSNQCLSKCIYSNEEHCKEAGKISGMELAKKSLDNICDIFFDEEYGTITLFLFSYCLAALFSSVLNQNNISSPFFLQIACDHTSALYQLVIEIIEICDVNYGFHEKCNKTHYNYIYCGYTNQTYYPTASTSQDIENLICNFKDNPVLIVGHENEHCYHSLLREIANIPTKKKALDLRDRFNLLPVFVCPVIKSSFDNVFNMDLTDLEISQEYLKLIKKNKQMLASWVLKLITDIDENASKLDSISKDIMSYINYIIQNNSNLTFKNARNIGFLNFFFEKFLNILQTMISPSLKEEFNLPKTIHTLTETSRKYLIQLHQRYLPVPIKVDIKNKEALQLAKRIEKCYSNYKVYIRLTWVDIKGEMYIFNIDTLNTTKDIDVSRNAKNVQRRLKNYECFRVDLTNKTTMKLIVAKRLSADNNLIEILTHKDFTESKLKIPYAMGFDEIGNMYIEDIEQFPHLLLGGATGSGKSTALMSLLMSIAYKHRTGNVNVLILDLLGKIESDFDVFNGQPFLSHPVITKPIEGAKAILSLYEEKKCRLENNNLSKMPYIVCIMDEFPRLFFDILDKNYTKLLIMAISDLLSSGRHARIHLILAAQNPIKEYMKGDIANITTRIAFKCAHYQNSNALLGKIGAEKLNGKGQMIFASQSKEDMILQGSYITKKDMTNLLQDIKEDFKQENSYPFHLTELDFVSIPVDLDENILKKENLSDIIIWSLSQQQIANSRIQAHFHIGNQKVLKILEQMEEQGLIHRMNGNRGWEVIPKCFEDIPIKTLDFLKENGLDEVTIKNAFNKRIQPVSKDVDKNNCQ